MAWYDHKPVRKLAWRLLGWNLGKKSCCRKEANIAEYSFHDSVLRICRVCGCRHFELTVDPGKFGLQGMEV